MILNLYKLLHCTFTSNMYKREEDIDNVINLIDKEIIRFKVFNELIIINVIKLMVCDIVRLIKTQF